jgi:hypothetical protein
MRLSRRPSIFMLLLLCGIMLSGRAAGIHLHLCFDGSEPPASVHFEDAGHHGEHHADEEHQDLDLSLAFEAIAKAVKQGLDLPVFLLAALLLLPPLVRTTLRRGLPEPPAGAFPSRLSLRPPLRGPPSPISL